MLLALCGAAGAPRLLAWQQRVHYTMDITVDTDRHSYTGSQHLVYYNNSPDTIRDVYYHLFYEAFKPGSMMDVRDREISGGGLRIGQLAPDEQGSVVVAELKQDGAVVEWSIDETILRARLAHPIAPGDSTVLEMRWQTRIPKLTRRGGWMSREGVEYSMSQWYPKLAEYDHNGWHADEYVGREFYGVYGTFDVAITLPSRYVLGATGVVTNPNDVGCGYELGERDTVVAPSPKVTGTKTWRFHAEDVHDFAWVADPEYVHHIVHWQGITIHALVTRGNNQRWLFAADWTRAMMEYYSRRFGRYAWPQFTVAMAGDGGMEYPQLIMITGFRTPVSLAGVIAHELGHQWFYGMIGNNETQEAWLDEGFTQYLTDEASREVLRTQFTGNPYQGLDRIVYPSEQKRWLNTESAYSLAIMGYDEPISTYHDRFREPITGSLPYWRGEAVLRMVQYMFGDSLFDAAMRHYYNTWRFRHPTARDFERAMEEASGMRLDWFFNQWVGTTKRCDYGLDGITSRDSAGTFVTGIRLTNHGEAIMPLDITLTYEDGSTATANIPVENWTKPGVEYHLPRWKWTSPSYETSFITAQRVVCATIDTSTLLFDIDRTNNTRGTGLLASVLPPISAAWYRRWDFKRPMDAYSVRLRPTVWYAKADGAQIGIVADGGYAFNRYNATVGLYYNARSERVDYDLRYDTPIGLLGRLGRVALQATNADGVQLWSARLEKSIRPYNYTEPLTQQLSLQVEREVLVGGNYANDVACWTPGGYNTVSLGYMIGGAVGDGWRMEGHADLDASFASATAFSRARLSGTCNWQSGPWRADLDLFAGAIEGTAPAQMRFNAAGATSREMHANLIQRLAMNAEPGFAARNHLVLPTHGYLLSLAELDAANRLGDGLINARIGIGNLNPFRSIIRLPILERMDVQLYGAAGWLFTGAVSLNGMRHLNAEAGAVVSIDVLNTLLPDVIVDAIDSPTPVRLSLHLPFVASSDLLNGNIVRYRWAIGVSM